MTAKYPAELEKQIVDLYHQGKTTLEIANITGVKYNTSVRRVLIRHGIDLISTSERNRKVKVNPFRNLQDPITQYWIGFIAADGNLSKDRHRIRLNTNLDPEHLDSYIKFIDAPLNVHKTYNKRFNVNEYCVSFTHTAAYDQLLKLGITPNKSLTFKANFNLNWSFVRGYFDGNGCVSPKVISISTGSKLFVEQLAEFYTNYGLKNSTRKGKDKNIYFIEVYSKEARTKWAKFIYNENFTVDTCLDRKKDKVIQFLLP